MRERISPVILGQIDRLDGTVDVVRHYGGFGLFLCWLGRHHTHGLEFDGDGTATDVLVCLRCGQTLSVVVSEYTEDE